MLTPKSWSLLLILHHIINAQFCTAVPPLDPSSTVSRCSCYQPTKDAVALFLNHQFFDFRTLINETFASNLTPPAPINDDQDGGIEPITSPFFGKGLFGDYFAPASWSKSVSPGSPIRMVNSQQNVYLSKSLPRFSKRRTLQF